jgi:CDP-glucose 4,6-dehydratase
VESLVSNASEGDGTGTTALFDGVYAGRRVLVTGDTGFKGSWLCAWLAGLGATVGGYALAPPTEPSLFELAGLGGEVAHVTGDVRDVAAFAAAVAAFAPQVVFHLAAQPLVRPSYADPRGTFETNVMGVVNLFEAVRSCPSVRVVVNVTSDKCYENDETAVPSPRPRRSAVVTPTAPAKAAPNWSRRPTGGASSVRARRCAWPVRGPAT